VAILRERRRKDAWMFTYGRSSGSSDVEMHGQIWNGVFGMNYDNNKINTYLIEL
jgi:hypothetical protein